MASAVQEERQCEKIAPGGPLNGSITDPGVERIAVDLTALFRFAERAAAVRKSELRPGDWVMVRTKNSVYVIGRDLEGRCTVSGGWFERAHRTPYPVEINGCTWGGSAIHTELLAAPGLFLEFANRVRTTRIQEVRHFRGARPNWVC